MLAKFYNFGSRTMPYETIYSIINLAVMPAWLLLALAPNADVTKRLVHSGIYPLVYGLFYTTLLVRGMVFGVASPDGDMGTLAGVMAMFDHPNSILLGWSHYLVFDLFVGAWIGRDALKRGVNQLIVIPCLFFTLMFGPIGLLAYIIVRKITGKGALELE
jgi:hypothetical protein